MNAESKNFLSTISTESLVSGISEIVAAHQDDKGQVDRPSFSNITDDFHLLENMTKFANICDKVDATPAQMAASLAKAIGSQNRGEYNVLVYDYVLAMPDYPLPQCVTWCNVICYKNTLFGVAVFPATEGLSIYFPGLAAYNQQSQKWVFSYGNRVTRYCTHKKALAFDFLPKLPPNVYPMMITPKPKRKINGNAHIDVDFNNNLVGIPEEPPPDYSQILLDELFFN